MGYNIGQLKRTQISSYTTNVTYAQGTLANTDSTETFYDQCLFLSGSSTASSAYSYYLKFTVQQLTGSVQDFTIKLKNSSASVDNEEDIRTYSVKQGTDSTTFELIFHPNNTYNELVFELSRLALDFNQQNSDGTNGRIMSITVEEFYVINNVINTLSTLYSGLTTITKIGVQGPPGMMLTIDGEEIRIGRSGIYELYNDDIDISYIGFVVKDSLFTQDGKDFFIMDFKY